MAKQQPVVFKACDGDRAANLDGLANALEKDGQFLVERSLGDERKIGRRWIGLAEQLRIIADELRQPTATVPAALLKEACETIDGLAEQQEMYNNWYDEPLTRFRAALTATGGS